MGIESGFNKASQETVEEQRDREGARIYVEVKNALLQIDLKVLNSPENADRKTDLKRLLRGALERLGE